MTQQSNINAIANFPDTATIPSAARAGRAIGAMFFSVFGCAWISNWTQTSYPSNWSLLISVVLIGLLLLLCAITVYRHNNNALDMIDPVQKKKTDRRFHIVNLGQWVAILITVNVLNNVGKPEWSIPAVIFIIGAHFMPLARLFRYFPHYLSGAALMAWAVAYPWLSVTGPANAIGSLGIGLVLWVSAVYALIKKA